MSCLKVQGLYAPSRDCSSVLPLRSESRSRPQSAGSQRAPHPLRSQPRQPRQKVPLLGGHGSPIVQPPLGATMGHGLLPSECTMREAVRKARKSFAMWFTACHRISSHVRTCLGLDGLLSEGGFPHESWPASHQGEFYYPVSQVKVPPTLESQ